MAKGDQATQDNASSMNASHAPLNFGLGGASRQFGTMSPDMMGGSGMGSYQPSSPIAPSQPPMMNNLIQGGAQMGGSSMGGRFSGGMGLPNGGKMPDSTMVGPGSATRMTGGGPMNSPIAPTDSNELIRRIMMMSRF